MEDEKTKAEGQEEVTTPGDTEQAKGGSSAETPNTDTPQSIPYDRFKEVNDRNKELANRLAKLEEEREQRESEAEKERKRQMKEQERYKELADELEQKLEEAEPRLAETQARLEKLETILEAHAAAQLDLVPEVYHPVLNKLPVEQRLEWITENRSKLQEQSKQRPAGVPPTPPGAGRAELSDDQRRRKSARTF